MDTNTVSVLYFYQNDCGVESLMKWLRDPEEGIYTGYIWNSVKKQWVENWELCCGAFYGFEPSKRINKQEAQKYMVAHGATEQEASKQIAEDLKKVR